MTVRFYLLGYQVAHIDVDLDGLLAPVDGIASEITKLDRGVKRVSGWWTRHML